MTIHTGELLKAAEIVAETRQMKVSLQYSLLGAGVTSLTTLAGGLLGGPAGLFFGATGGGLLSYKMSKDKFKSLVSVLQELSPAQKSRLANHLTAALKDFDITDAVMLMAAVRSNQNVIQVVMLAVKNFIEVETRHTVTYS